MLYGRFLGSGTKATSEYELYLLGTPPQILAMTYQVTIHPGLHALV